MENVDEKTIKEEIKDFIKIAKHECVIDSDTSKELEHFINWYLLNYR